MKKSLHDLQYFQTLVRSGEWYWFNLRRAERTKENLEWNDTQVKALLCGLSTDDFQKTVKNCIVNDLNGYEFIDSDQYEIHWHEESRTRRSDPESGTISLSLKIAIVDDAEGTCAGVITFHLSGQLAS